MDYWFAECVPCKWQTKHGKQDAAIASAEMHVADYHARVPAAERAQKVMGHVQLRGEDAMGYEFPQAQAQKEAAERSTTALAHGTENPPAEIQQVGGNPVAGTTGETAGGDKPPGQGA